MMVLFITWQTQQNLNATPKVVQPEACQTRNAL